MSSRVCGLGRHGRVRGGGADDGRVHWAGNDNGLVQHKEVHGVELAGPQRIHRRVAAATVVVVGRCERAAVRVGRTDAAAAAVGDRSRGRCGDGGRGSSGGGGGGDGDERGRDDERVAAMPTFALVGHLGAGHGQRGARGDAARNLKPPAARGHGVLRGDRLVGVMRVREERREVRVEVGHVGVELRQRRDQAARAVAGALEQRASVVSEWIDAV